MIVDTGTLALLGAQLTYLASLDWVLFTNNVAIVESTLWTDLNEASWTGYLRQPAGAWGTPFTNTPRAQSNQSATTTFMNTSGAPQTYFGVALIDTGGPTLIWAQNLGSTTLPDGGAVVYAPIVTDREE